MNVRLHASEGLSGRAPDVYQQWAAALVELLRHSVPTDPAHAELVDLLTAIAHETAELRMTRRPPDAANRA